MTDGLSIASICISVAAAGVAGWNALEVRRTNAIAREANEIAERADERAAEANEIAERADERAAEANAIAEQGLALGQLDAAHTWRLRVLRRERTNDFEGRPVYGLTSLGKHPARNVTIVFGHDPNGASLTPNEWDAIDPGQTVEIESLVTDSRILTARFKGSSGRDAVITWTDPLGQRHESTIQAPHPSIPHDES